MFTGTFIHALILIFDILTLLIFVSMIMDLLHFDVNVIECIKHENYIERKTRVQKK